MSLWCDCSAAAKLQGPSAVSTVSIENNCCHVATAFVVLD